MTERLLLTDAPTGRITYHHAVGYSVNIISRSIIKIVLYRNILNIFKMFKGNWSQLNEN
jgi:hypothetical protein